MQCWRCRAENPPVATFCQGCGRTLRGRRDFTSFGQVFAIIGSTLVVSLSLLSHYFIRNSEPSGGEFYSNYDIFAFFAWLAAAILMFISFTVALNKSRKAVWAAVVIGAIALGVSCTVNLAT